MPGPLADQWHVERRTALVVERSSYWSGVGEAKINGALSGSWRSVTCT